jgi:uncharacterized protein
MALVTCPICRRRFESQTTAAMPFCSERCRMIDLGKWLNEDYGIPIETEEAEDERPFDDE